MQRCVKVIDRDVDSYRFLESNLSYEENTLLSKDEINLLAMKRSKRIEKYDFIVTGYETVNVTEEHFGVLKCNNCNLSISNDDVFKDFRP